MKPTKLDIMWNYLGIFVSLGSNFILLPIIIYFLNDEMIGLWYIFISFSGIVGLLDFGFSPTLARNVSYCWSGVSELSKKDAVFSPGEEPNVALLVKVLHVCKKIYLGISTLALLILSSLGTIYISYISKDLSGADHLYAWGIFCAATIINLYYGYYSVFLRGIGAIGKYNIASVISKVIQIVLSVILLLFGLGLLAVSVGYLISGFILRMISRRFFINHENIRDIIRIRETDDDRKDLWDTFMLIWHNAWKDGLVSLSKYLSGQITIIICSIYLGLAVTGMYSIAVQLISAIAIISSSLYSAYQPAMQSAYVRRDIISSRSMLSKSIVSYVFLYTIGTVLLIVVGMPLLQLIRPEVIISVPVILAIALYEFLFRHHSLYASYISNSNSVPYMNSFVGYSILSVIISIVSLAYFDFGLWAILISQILVQACYNNWYWPRKVLISLNLTFIEFIKLGTKGLQGEFKRIFPEKR